VQDAQHRVAGFERRADRIARSIALVGAIGAGVVLSSGAAAFGLVWGYALGSVALRLRSWALAGRGRREGMVPLGFMSPALKGLGLGASLLCPGLLSPWPTAAGLWLADGAFTAVLLMERPPYALGLGPHPKVGS